MQFVEGEVSQATEGMLVFVYPARLLWVTAYLSFFGDLTPPTLNLGI